MLPQRLATGHGVLEALPKPEVTMAFVILGHQQGASTGDRAGSPVRMKEHGWNPQSTWSQGDVIKLRARGVASVTRALPVRHESRRLALLTV